MTFFAGVIFGASHLIAFSTSAFFGPSRRKSGEDAVFNDFKRSSMDADSLNKLLDSSVITKYNVPLGFLGQILSLGHE